VHQPTADLPAINISQNCRRALLEEIMKKKTSLWVGSLRKTATAMFGAGGGIYA